MIRPEEIDSEMYLRDGYPHATVCKVQLKDGRIGVGVFRQRPGTEVDHVAADAAALADALEHVPAPADDDDTQANLGQPAHE